MTTSVPLQTRDTNLQETNLQETSIVILKKKTKSVSFSNKENTENIQQDLPQTEKPTLIDTEPQPEPQPNQEETKVEEIKDIWGKYLTDYRFQDFGGKTEGEEDQENPLFYEVTNDHINTFDEIEYDDDNMSLSVDSESELSEDGEAKEYATFLNMSSTDHALERVGSNDLLFSWIEKQFKEMDDKTIASYERITIEIEKVLKKVRAGYELVLQYFLSTDSGIWVSDASVDFVKRLFMQYATVVFETACMIASLREENNNVLFQVDFVAALKHLGRAVYFDKIENMEDEENGGFDSFFDPEAMRILTGIVFGDLKVNDETYTLIQKGFEDFFSILVCNACKLQKEYKEDEPVTVQDLKVVINLWQNSPYESSNSLIQKITL